MYRYLFFYLFVIVHPIGYAQQKQLDSLSHLLKSAPNDSNKLILYNHLITKSYNIGQFEKALTFSLEELALAEKIHQPRGTAEMLHVIGNIYFAQGNYLNALNYYFKSLKKYETLQMRSGVANTLGNIGIIYHLQGDYEKALTYYLKAQKMHSDEGNKKDQADDLNNIGNLYLNEKKYTAALNYYLRSLVIRKEIADAEGEATSLNNIGSIYKDQNKYELALDYFSRSLTLSNKIGDVVGKAISFVNIGAIYLEQSHLKNAELYLQKSLALSMEIGDLETVKEANQSLCKLYSIKNDYVRALAFYKAFIICKDSLQNEESTKETVRLEMNYEFDKKESAAKLEQEKKMAVALAESKKQKIIISTAFGVLVLVCAFALFAYKSYVQKLKVNIRITKQKEIIEEKQKEILDSIHYARRIQIALMPNEKYLEKNLNRLIKGE